MASATSIPANVAAARGYSEDEPLLGRRGDASQPEGHPLYHNLWIGEASTFGCQRATNITQALQLLRREASGLCVTPGLILRSADLRQLAAIIWGAILTQKLIFFSAHPVHDPNALVPDQH